MLKRAFSTNKDTMLQARYLSMLADVDFEAATQMQMSLAQPDLAEGRDENEQDLLQKLIEEAMPVRKKVKKTNDVDVQNIDGGAQIYIPMKRKRKPKMPKNFDPENPGPMPDPERWLPKFMKSRYKKLAKKRGIYLKGAQGDAQIDTDVSKNPNVASTGVVQTGNNTNRNKRRRK